MALETRREVGEPRLDVAPAPWEYNPASWEQRVRVGLVALVGVLLSTYMGLFQLGLLPTVWDPVFGEGSRNVLLSDVSHTMTRWFRIPDAMLGSLAYLGDLIFALAGSTRRWQYRPWLVIVFGIDVIPLGIVSAVLVVLQGTMVGAWCFLCLVTAVISLTLVVLAYDEVWSCLRFLRRVWLRSRSWRTLWNTFIGRPSRVAAEAARDVAEARG
jgi:uncharacterized membrane protein